MSRSILTAALLASLIGLSFGATGAQAGLFRGRTRVIINQHFRPGHIHGNVAYRYGHRGYADMTVARCYR